MEWFPRIAKILIGDLTVLSLIQNVDDFFIKRHFLRIDGMNLKCQGFVIKLNDGTLFN